MAVLKIVAFDCDGVLFDTAVANRSYYNKIIGLMGRPEITDEQFAYVHMHTVEASLIYLCGAENLEWANQCRKQSGYLPFIKHMKKAQGLEALLDSLRGRFHTAIATNRSNTMDRVLSEHGLAGEFEIVVTALDVERAKPAPDQLFKILDYFQARPPEMVYIGDSELDEYAAHSAGVPFIAFGNLKLKADFHATTMAEVQKIIKTEILTDS